MAKDKKEKAELKSLKTNVLSRGLTLLNLTVASGAKYAGFKLGETLLNKEKRDQKLQEFLRTQAQKLVDEFGKLKGSIMKAGQMLSVYGEHFFPPEINQILKKLQNESQPVEWSEMEKVIRSQLDEDILNRLEINPRPIAAASLGQVYQARILDTNETVALKVQYPGVDQAIDNDLRFLKSLLSITKLVPMGPSFEEVFKEIRMLLLYEVDYQRERETLEHYRELLKDDPRFIIPKVYAEFSTKRILTMSMEEGFGVDSPEVKHLSQLERNRLAASFMELMYREIFEWRMVQTDPHFGNYKIRLDSKDGNHKIILLDFGAVRKFPKRYIEPFAQLVYSALMDDDNGMIKAGRNLGFLNEEDPEEVNMLFTKICTIAIEGFSEKYESPEYDGSNEGKNPYIWGDTDLLTRLTGLAKDAVFAFRFRSPPREAIFLDRKMVGTFILVSSLKLRLGPRKMIMKYLEPYLHLS